MKEGGGGRRVLELGWECIERVCGDGLMFLNVIVADKASGVGIVRAGRRVVWGLWAVKERSCPSIVLIFCGDLKS